eukprot:CAMPEP_0172504684 /NCGR_PEP_ID=MMETSP1066-20121228/180497_1 /TAXON_ID=671091 /ORGANISM="Coscinodiscus wailesii, Strain CCMP2513" /LENGTH=261 /DNA_ID=CAMNT_0013280959 /DNA_START=71 /DNA_END=856 /DNA_ORIENTATION=+
MAHRRAITHGIRRYTAIPTLTSTATKSVVTRHLHQLTNREPKKCNRRGHNVTTPPLLLSANHNNSSTRGRNRANFTTDDTSSKTDQIPYYQNPHVTPDMRILEEEFHADGEEMPIYPLPPFDDGSGKVLASPELHALAEEIIHMSMYDVHQLTKLVADFFGIEDEPAMMAGAAAGGGAGAVAAEEVVEEEKTAFDLKLTGFDAKSKLKVIKEIRAITSLGLKEAKEMVEGAPKVIKKGITKEEAEGLKEKLEAIGGTVEIS